MLDQQHLHSSHIPTTTTAATLSSTLPTSLPCGLNITTNNDLHGTIALGPSRSERDILQQCCHTLDVASLDYNGSKCLHWARCEVGECGGGDPAYVCVAEMRREWKVEGLVVCAPGKKGAAGKGKGKGTVWGVVVVGIVVTAMVVGGV